MNLVIDIGNTAVKVYLFKNNVIIKREVLSENALIQYLKLIAIDDIRNIICSSVTKSYKDQLSKIFKNSNYFDFSDNNLKIPFTNNYETKKSLGQDRIGLISSAVLKFQDQNSLVIDMGTCITYDFIDSQNIYHGGAISPGIRMRYSSFSNYTSNLPLLKFQDITKIIGANTEESLHIGINNGIVGEINQYINSLKKSYSEFNVIITGGDSIFLLNKIKNAIFADQDFLASGLNYIIKLNEGE
ncbi:type III pantothenate kinase [Flavobacteriaceae bacterium]|nr:type III pantothenate kinase [Flavobacteriaceae bacterium]MDA9041972.1 type III pantothenate kinase [Flavobacteriaceae bacterium]MDC0984470.1 type III pantothenate kinase [Flavobacteriaceae bacterium]MDC6473483.1 type III pantothenate kinase [Flavobacteriaceae bacterium]|tara:strand:+ start:252 stop:980 length:729 start_codon:yes stop_codon:yes gene_type:complete